MSEWFDVGVFAVFTALCFFIVPLGAARYAVAAIADRNPEWPAANPEAARRFGRLSLFSMATMVLGGAAVSALVAYQLGWYPAELSPEALRMPRWEVLQSVYTVFAVSALVCFAFQTWRFARHLEREVPMAAQRSATLARRTLGEFVPRWLSYVTTGGVLAVLGARVAVGLIRHEPAAYWTNLGTAALLWVSVSILTIATIRQRPTFMDRILGPDYRKANVWSVYSIHYLIVIWGALSFYEALTGHDVVNEARGGLLSVIGLTTICTLLMIARWKLPPLDASGTPVEQQRASLLAPRC